jgi:glutamate-1-semialdehyde 2,1-aminomutase
MWAGGFPLFFSEASGARVTDVDGHVFVDFCLGDTGAMAGHAPEPTARAVERQVRRGTTVMLPDEDAAWVGRELVRRFGMDAWQFSLTATDANRWVLRMARALTGRPKILVFNYCYHGTVDETVISIEGGVPQARPGNVGPAVDPTVTTKVVEFNDIDALREALAPGDVAAVLAEPALTNIGIVLPDAGFHDALRAATRETGTLLIIDETHTFSSGPGGYTGAHGLDPDILTIGKSIAGGVPIGAYGLRRELADRILELDVDLEDVGGVGGTLAGNALSLAAARATLGEVLTDEAFGRMIGLAERYTAGVNEVLESRRVPWNIVQLGARAEYRFTPEPPRNGGESAAAHDGDLDADVPGDRRGGRRPAHGGVRGRRRRAGAGGWLTGRSPGGWRWSRGPALRRESASQPPACSVSAAPRSRSRRPPTGSTSGRPSWSTMASRRRRSLPT